MAELIEPTSPYILNVQQQHQRIKQVIQVLLLKYPWLNNQQIKQVIQEPGPCPNMIFYSSNS